MDSLRRLLCQRWSGGVLVGLLAFILVIATLDPSGSYPGLVQGPGLTVDEVFNVQQGVLLVEVLRTYGIWILDPVNVREIFGEAGLVPYLPDHPPLGRFVLGLGHHVMWSLAAPDSPEGMSVTACARFGSAVLFGLTIFLVGATAGTWFGKEAGWFASISVLLMPRVFSHAHLASLESCVNLTYALAVLCLADQWNLLSEREQEAASIHWKRGLFPGAMLGLAMLTKIQGFLVIPMIILWALWYGRRRAIPPLLVWGVTGLVVFFVGWPWLWLDPVGHLREFLGSATDRTSLNVWYLGKRYADVDTPWHYPWLMFAVTVPLGLHLLGLAGLVKAIQKKTRDRRLILVLMCLVFPLVLFSTRAAVYDGERLFLMLFPLWGVFIGLGGKQVWDWLRRKKSFKQSMGLTTIFFLLQGWGLVAMHPCQLSYYNLLVGGLRGADAIGLERTYWSDSITRSFLQECVGKIPPGTTIEVAPVLHQFQVEEMEVQSPLVRRQKWKFQAYSEKDVSALRKSGRKRYVMIYYRLADLPDCFHPHSHVSGRRNRREDRKVETLGQPVVELKREGVPLAALFQIGDTVSD